MKNSGIEWIGEIPDSWEVNLVKNIFDITRGRVIAKTEIEDEPLEDYYPVYSSQTANSGILGYIPSYDFAVDSLTWTTDGAKAGTVFLRRGKYSITNVCGILTLKSKKYSLDYLNYAVGFSAYNCRRADINGYKIMSNEMAIIPIVVPYLEEQQRIAKHLDEKCGKIDELIANQEKQIEKLKEYKQSIITEAVTKGLDKSAPMKDSNLSWIIGKVPAHWAVVNPKALFSLRRERAKEGERQLTASQQYGVIYQDDYMRLTGSRIVVVMKDFDILKHVEKGDFVISMRSFQGGLEYSENDGSISSAYVMLKPNRKYVVDHFYKWLFKSSLYINALQSTSDLIRDGQAMRYSNFTQLWLYQIPLKEQEQIASYLDKKCADIDKLIAIKQEKIEKLQEYKKSLIYEYVTGKKEVV